MYFIDELQNRKDKVFAVKCKSLKENQFVFEFLISNNMLCEFSETTKKELASHFEYEQILFIMRKGKCSCIKEFQETDKARYDIFDFSDFNWKAARPSKDEYYLHIAETVSERSTCLRRQYGAVIVKDDRIVATGYNGSARGETNCCDAGYCYRTAHNLPHNSGYTSDCPAVHAEANAIMQAGASNTVGATLYLAGFEGDSSVNAEPCVMCRRVIKNAQIKRIVVFTANREVVEIEV